jgi:hypothetical protein
VSGNWIGSIKINGLQDSINLSLWRGWEDVYGVRFFKGWREGKLLELKINSMIQHWKMIKCIVIETMFFNVGEYFLCSTYTNVNNEKNICI